MSVLELVGTFPLCADNNDGQISVSFCNSKQANKKAKLGKHTGTSLEEKIYETIGLM